MRLLLILARVMLVLLVTGGGSVFLFRKKKGSDEDLPDIGEPVDYTVPEDDEDEDDEDDDESGGLPLPAKIAIGCVPLLLIGLIAIGFFVVKPMLTGGDGQSEEQQAQQQQQPSGSITIDKAILASEDSIRIEGKTTELDPNTELKVDLVVGGEPFEWLPSDVERPKVNDNRFEARLEKAPDTPKPTAGMTYSVRLTAILADGPGPQAEKELEIPDMYRSGFLAPASSADAETDSAEEESPEETSDEPPEETSDEPPEETGDEPPEESDEPPEETGDEPPEETSDEPPEETSDEPPEESDEPPSPVPSVFVAQVTGAGGNLRTQPSTAGNEPIKTVNAQQSVELLKQNPSGEWFYVKTQQNDEGWMHGSVLQVDQTAKEKLPVEEAEAASDTEQADEQPEQDDQEPAADSDLPTGTVTNGGNFREQPTIEGNVIGQLCAGDSIVFLKRSGSWYNVRVTETVADCVPERVSVNTEGWFHSSLLSQPSSPVPTE